MGFVCSKPSGYASSKCRRPLCLSPATLYTCCLRVILLSSITRGVLASTRLFYDVLRCEAITH